jgi:putative MFS transporter
MPVRPGQAMFWAGSLCIMAGVGMHIPMFLDCASMGYRMVGMSVDPMMMAGMGLIVLGTVAAGFGLLPPRLPAGTTGGGLDALDPAILGGEPARLTRAHWELMVTLAIALVIDTMKPASLGFVVPGMAKEYGLTRAAVAVLPFSALSGTMVGSFVWGVLADLLGRRAAILLAAVMFIGTSICGAMPSFAWNIVMCFLMGLSAGGMLPITYTLLAETIPTRHRGWFLVLLGGLGSVGGYIAASSCAAMLEPTFGWRIMWFLGLPTGLLLIALNQFIPESPKFLLRQGRLAEARQVLARFNKGAGAPIATAAPGAPAKAASGDIASLLTGSLAARTIILNFSALAWGLVNFGVLLWLPADLRARGFGVAASNALLAQSALIALPTAALTAWFYATWSTKWTLVLLSVLTAAGLINLSLLGANLPLVGHNPIVPLAILIFGTNGVIAALLPYTAENYPTRVRGTGVGLVAGGSKLGGVAAQILGMMGMIPAVASAAMVLAFPVLISAALLGRYGVETRARVLDELR